MNHIKLAQFRQNQKQTKKIIVPVLEELDATLDMGFNLSINKATFRYRGLEGRVGGKSGDRGPLTEILGWLHVNLSDLDPDYPKIERVFK